MQQLLDNINYSASPFHAVKRVSDILLKDGYERLFEDKDWQVKKGGKYFVCRNDSSLIAFNVGEEFLFNIAAAHSDSPCLKLKGSPVFEKGNLYALNAEVYGAPILNSFFDRQLILCGRAYFDKNKKANTDGFETEVVKDNNDIECHLIKSKFNVVIPNVALHLNREVNNGVKLNPQVDMCPIFAYSDTDNQFLKDALSYEIFISVAEKGYVWGKNQQLFSSPRLDDLAGVFASLSGFIDAKAKGINMLAVFDNEEIGSRTKQGAGSTFLMDTMERIAFCLDKDIQELKRALSQSMMLSVDNAHASHPNHPQYDDPTNKTILGGGLAIKHNAKFNYTTDAFTSALLRKLFNKEGIRYQDFYVKSDLNGGSTLGIVSSGPVSIPSADIGLPQLAMHSAVESASVGDYKQFVKGITAFFGRSL